METKALEVASLLAPWHIVIFVISIYCILLSYLRCFYVLFGARCVGRYAQLVSFLLLLGSQHLVCLFGSPELIRTIAR